ncbi:MAG TPA: hypothetical protein VIM59_14640 [Cellvibrio sp.]
MSDNLEFEYKDLHVSVTYNRSTNTVKRRVTNTGKVIYEDELNFDKSLVGNFDVMGAEEQGKITTAWGAAGIKTRIDDGQFGVKNYS